MTGEGAKSLRSLLAYVGRRGMYNPYRTPSTFRVPVTVTDVREAYGRVDVEVEADGGEGRAWVDRDSIKFETRGENDNDNEDS